jgi:nitroreductase
MIGGEGGWDAIRAAMQKVKDLQDQITAAMDPLITAYKTLGIERGDAAGRDASMRRNFEFFGAPVAMFFFVHKALGEYSVSDVSLFNQNLMLSAHAHGLGTCAQGVLGLWADVIREEFEVPAEYKLVYGMSLGYPSDHVVNQFGAERLPIAEILIKGK